MLSQLLDAHELAAGMDRRDRGLGEWLVLAAAAFVPKLTFCQSSRYRPQPIGIFRMGSGFVRQKQRIAVKQRHSVSSPARAGAISGSLVSKVSSTATGRSASSESRC